MIFKVSKVKLRLFRNLSAAFNLFSIFVAARPAGSRQAGLASCNAGARNGGKTGGKLLAKAWEREPPASSAWFRQQALTRKRRERKRKSRAGQGSKAAATVDLAATLPEKAARGGKKVARGRAAGGEYGRGRQRENHGRNGDPQVIPVKPIPL
tara:strand:- start:9884 stop:10342 length:459 start_codon:yes stop_codon:yes gene_type:complete